MGSGALDQCINPLWKVALRVKDRLYIKDANIES